MRTLIVLGVIVSMTVTLYTYSIRHTTAANAALLVNSAPIYVALLAPIFLKEPRARFTWLSLGLAIIGTICVSDPAQLKVNSDSFTGILAAALSGFTYAFVLMISRSLRGRVSGLTQTMWSNAIVALVLLPLAVQSSGAAVVSNLPTLIPLGIFSLGLSYLLYFQGLQRISAQVVSVVALFEPVSGALMGMLFFAEMPKSARLDRRPADPGQHLPDLTVRNPHPRPFPRKQGKGEQGAPATSRAPRGCGASGAYRATSYLNPA